MRVDQNITVFSNVTCELGEGPLWHPQRQSLFWLDIVNKTLFEKGFESEQSSYDHQWALPFASSALAVHSRRSDVLWMVTENSFGEFELATGRYISRIELPISENFRSNDGGVAPNGDFWFGVMEKHPTGRKGGIFSVSASGQIIKQLNKIGIPNTLCWLNNGQKFLLSDSLRQIMLSYQVLDGCLQEASEKIYMDLRQTSATPDGGAIDEQCRLWNAQWDGSCVACYDAQGQFLQRIELCVPRPTSCCFGGPDNKHLFITSAHEGLSISERERFSLSGCVFVIELSTPGRDIPAFNLENVEC